LALLAILPSPHANQSKQRTESDSLEPKSVLPVLKSLLPIADTIDSDPDANGRYDVYDQAGKRVGRIATTMPDAASVKGYRGPTEALLLLSDANTILAVGLLRSHDTTEHVEEVRASDKFLNQFVGLNLGDADQQATDRSIDGVSGATLTSLAMAEGIFQRMGKASRSLVFSQPIMLDDATIFWDSADSVIGDSVAGVVDFSGVTIGTILRSGDFVDDEIGYQGPTELLIKVDDEDKVAGIQIRHSFDNEPYVDYVRDEKAFWQLFEGKSFDDLAQWDPAAQQVEGVSGATMTSMAIAYTIPEVAKRISQAGGIEKIRQQSVPLGLLEKIKTRVEAIRWSVSELSMLGLLGVLYLASVFHWMHHHVFRWIWLVSVIAIVGIWTGNLVSLALLTGWASAGISWHLAIGLLVIVAVAVLLPPTNKSNPYCSHLCPHGAVQQLIRPTSKSRRRLRLSQRSSNVIRYLPAITLAMVYLALLLKPSMDVSIAEPFYAYSWRVASWTSIGFATATLVFSAMVPMGYCRLGCPTGRLIEHLRLGAKRDQITAFDFGMVILLAAAVLLRFA
jgi:uncharacterized protein with FMN-binding domain